MEVRSLGYRTDLIFPAFDGEIVDCGDYLVIRSPTNPTFYWGNFLLFSRPPQAGDYDRWRELFAKEIGAPPQVNHMTFGWEDTTGAVGEVAPFLEAGFRINHFVVLAARGVQPPRYLTREVQVRPLRSDEDWKQALENQVRCREPEFEENGYRRFMADRLARLRAMHRAGLGDWYGAFQGPQLVADLGIFHDQELGRFQSVATHPQFRRRGIAGTLVYEAARQALTQYNLERLVIVADEGSAPARLYGSVGFETVEHQVGLEWWVEMDQST